jgi:hypothetical protein
MCVCARVRACLVQFVLHREHQCSLQGMNSVFIFKIPNINSVQRNHNFKLLGFAFSTTLHAFCVWSPTNAYMNNVS